MKKLLIFLLLVTSGKAFATCHAAGPANVGSGTGADWNNVKQLPTNPVRGDIYYLKDGSYGSYAPTTATSGTTRIVIKKAQAYDFGRTSDGCPNDISAGWVPATMGASQAVFSAVAGSFTTSGGQGFYTLDGNGKTTTAGCGVSPAVNAAASDCGIKLAASAPSGSTYGVLWLNGNFDSGATRASGWIVRFIEIQGAGDAGNTTTNSNEHTFYCRNGCNNLLFEHNYLHESACDFIDTPYGQTVTFNLNHFKQNASSANCHGQFWLADGNQNDSYTFSNNLIQDVQGTAYWSVLNGGQASNWNIYNNVIFQASGTTRPGVSSGTFVVINTGSFATGINIVDNSWINDHTDFSNHFTTSCDGTCTGTFTFQGNLLYGIVDDQGNHQPVGGPGFTNTTESYNSFLVSGTITGWSGTGDITNNTATNPLVNWPSYNFNLTGNGTNVNSSLALSAPFNVDAAGNARPSGGTWNRGAFEFSANQTWYIRSDGGTRKDANVPAGQCDGLSDVAQSGSTGNHCAFSDWRYMWDDGTFACANNCWAMNGGDIVIIRGCASGSTSTAPDCRIGSDTQTASGSIWCPGVGNAGCYNPPIPAGTAGQHTRILGQNYAACSTGTPGTINYTVDKTKLTQLFGGWGVGLVLNLTSTQYVDVQCLQLWRHSQCIFFGSPASPAACNRSFPSEDDYVDSAIALNASTSNILLQDMWIHGMLSRGTLGPIGGLVDMERVDVDTNGGAGLDFDDGSATPFGAGASLTLNNSIIEWNGCNQEYPFVDAIPVASCYSQSTGGYGDGIGTPNANTGLNVSMNQSIFRYNTQDGFDFGHVENTGFTFVLTNSISYGNGGGALKWSDGFASQKAVNNLAIANCFRMSQPITGTPSGYNAHLGDFCRAGDAISINTKTGDSTLFANNTIVTYAPTTFDIGCNDPTTCATSTFNMFNNIVIGYDNPATYSGGGQAGGPGGFCLPGCNGTTHPITLLTTQYNDYYLIRTITCPTGNTGEICNNPLLTSQPTGQAGGFVESQLDVYTAALTSNLIPTNGSPVTLAGTNCAGCATNDFNNNAFTSPHPIGAFNPAGIIVPPAASLDGASGFSGKVTTP